jgi:hypothetical protein
MKASQARAKLLFKLIDVDSMTLSSFSKNKALINEYKNQKIINIISLPQGKRVQKGEYFQSHVERYYQGNLKKFLMTENRADLVKIYGDDKIKHVAPQEGLFVWSKDAIVLSTQTTIENEEGVITFVHHSVDINLEGNVLVVGVENFESLVKAKSLYKTFNFAKPVLFIYRNSTFLTLIKKIKNNIEYIPDYDIFGIRIYETEILKYNASVTLLIPSNIEDIFDTINTHKKYIEQKHMKGGEYQAVTQVGRELIGLMKKYRCIIPQEYLHG